MQKPACRQKRRRHNASFTGGVSELANGELLDGFGSDRLVLHICSPMTRKYVLSKRP